jgi:hypothetical protein
MRMPSSRMSGLGPEYRGSQCRIRQQSGEVRTCRSCRRKVEADPNRTPWLSAKGEPTILLFKRASEFSHDQDPLRTQAVTRRGNASFVSIG